MNSTKKLVKAINTRFAKKQNELSHIPAEMGNGYGGLEVDGMDSFIYVMVNGKSVPVFNNRVANQRGTKVWVGYSAEEPQLFQVLSTRSETPAGAQNGYVGYAPARRYEWHAPQGGQDPLYVHLRAMTPLRLSVSDTEADPGELLVNLYRGYVYNGERYYKIERQDLDIAEHVPTTINKAAFVLVTINNAGTVIQTKGNEVDINALALTDIPALPTTTIYVCGAVRVYYGQLKVLEGRTNTDFVDLRLTGYGVGGSSGIVILDEDGEALTNEPQLQFTGTLLEIEHDADNDRIIVTVDVPDIPVVALGINRWSAIATDDTFTYSDIVLEIQSVEVNGLLQDPITYTLSEDGTQLTLDDALPFDAIVTSSYLIRST